MKNQLLSKLNKKATNYTVSRTAIDRCASEGYIFTSSKFKLESALAQVCATIFIDLKIVQAVEVYCASLTKSFAVKKISNAIDGTKLETSNFAYEFTDFFTTDDRQRDLAVIKITTFDIPEKHLSRIALHRNSFNDLSRYLQTVPMETLTHLYPEYKQDEESTTFIRLQLINCDQYEYRIKQIVLEDTPTNYFEFEASIGEIRTKELTEKLDIDNDEKIKALFRVNKKSKEAMSYLSERLVESYPLTVMWLLQDLSTRDRESIFEINKDYLNLIVRLSGQDLAALQKLKTANEAFQYLTSVVLV